SVERELAHGRVPVELRSRQLTRRAEHGERDRQVEPGAFLAELRRRKVDGDPAVREVELGGGDAAPDTFTRFLAGLVGQADDREARQPVANVRLDVDAARLEADESVSDRAREHGSTL